MTDNDLRSRWEGYLCHGKSPLNLAEEIRSPFHKDFDRILFSAAFRRLQDKTQVYPLAQNDFVRRRLTHSLEVASVGRCFGRKLGSILKSKDYLPDGYDPDHVGSIVSAYASGESRG